MKRTGTLWAIGTYHNIFRVGRLLQDLGFWILNDVTWVKTNPMPNWLGVRFTNATETLIWAAMDRDAKGYAFDRDAAKEFGIGKVGASVWVLPTCGGRERVKSADGKKAHSAQKPAELLRRVILSSTRPGDLVLDPMAGVGTTGYIARALGRRFVMIEESAEYVAAMQRRFAAPVAGDRRRAPESTWVNEYMKLAGEQ
jgi:DNA modification methylase